MFFFFFPLYIFIVFSCGWASFFVVLVTWLLSTILCTSLEIAYCSCVYQLSDVG